MLPIVTIEKSPTKSFVGQIIEQIDLKLLKNAAFTLFAISNFLTSLGFNVVYNYADDLANDSKVIKDQRTYIVMSIGLSNILGRVIIGYLADRKWVRKCFTMKISICQISQVNRLLLFIVTLIVSGVATMVAPLCGSSVIPHIGYASFFGFFSGGYVALTAIVLVDIVGIEKLSDAFGVLLLFIGVATAIGTPIAGEYLMLNFDCLFTFV
jgi:MFS family permease